MSQIPPWVNLAALALSMFCFAIEVHQGDSQMAVFDILCAAFNLVMYQWKINDNTNSEKR